MRGIDAGTNEWGTDDGYMGGSVEAGLVSDGWIDTGTNE